MPPVKTHSTVFNQGQQFVINTHSVSTPPLEQSAPSLLSLTHSHSVAHCSSSPLPLAGKSSRSSLYFGLSTASQKGEFLQLISMPAPIWLSLRQLHSSLKSLSSSSSSSSPFFRVHLPYKQGTLHKHPLQNHSPGNCLLST